MVFSFRFISDWKVYTDKFIEEGISRISIQGKIKEFYRFYDFMRGIYDRRMRKK